MDDSIKTIDIIYLYKSHKSLFSQIKDTVDYHKLGKTSKNSIICNAEDFAKIILGVVEKINNSSEVWIILQANYAMYIHKNKLTNIIYKSE